MKNMDEIPHTRTSFIFAVSSFFWELLKAFILAMVIIVPIRYFIVQPFFVRGASMEPNFHDGEYLVVDQLSYRFREPARGEVVVFRYPQDHSQFFIKRIVGLPGEEVFVQDGRVIIRNAAYASGGELQEAEYLDPSVRTRGQVHTVLGPGEYFVLGDNRPASSDSRSWGSVSRDEIVGRTWFRAWPLNKILFFPSEKPQFIPAA
jgi:signal peptidase I